MSVPAVTPVTTPDVFIVALAFEAVQVPPADVSVSVIVLPVHTVDAPPIAAGVTGAAITDSGNVVVAVPQVLVTV